MNKAVRMEIIKNNNVIEKLLLLICIIIGFLIGLLSILLIDYINNSIKIFIIGLVVILVAIILINRRYKHYGLCDPYLLFLVFFTIYNGSILIQFAFELNNNILSLQTYPLSFDSDIVIYSGFLVIIAIFALIIGEILSNVIVKKIMIKNNIFNIKTNSLLYTGIIMYTIGLMLFFMNYQRIGGFLHYLSLPRGTNMILLSQQRGSLPYTSFIFPGIAAIYFVYYSKKEFFKKKDKKILFLFLLFLTIWIILMLVQGDRRFLTYSLIIVFGIWSTRKKINKKIIIILVLCLIFFLFFAHVRFLITPIINKNMTIEDGYNWILKNININWFLPAENEFAGPYFTLLYSISNQKELLYGSSYIYSIPYILPRSLYPGVKPLTISQNFAINIYNTYLNNWSFPVGWGYSPITEAFVNFGVYGVFVIFVLYGLFLSIIDKFKYKNFFTFMIYLMILPETLNINRIDFSIALQELFINIIGLAILAIIYEVLGKVSAKYKFR